MGRYLELATSIEPTNRESTPVQRPTTATDEALKVLHSLYKQHEVNAAKKSGASISRVLVSDWQRAAIQSEFTFCQSVRDLEERGAIIRENGYVRPLPLNAR